MCDDFETDLINGDLVETSEGLLNILSPSLQRHIKKRRSTLGEAMRIKTPNKVNFNPSNLPVWADKENDQNIDNRIRPPLVPDAPSSAKKSSLFNITNDHVRGLNEIENKSSRSWRVDDFVLGKPLGRGKFGNVYFAKQKKSNLPIALKVLFKAQMNNNLVVKMLKREIEIQYRLKHENINQLYGYFHDTKNVYLLLEYAENGEFYKFLSKNRGKIPESQCKIYVQQIAKALAYMHRRFVYHRDIKPENILMNSKDKLILADFGSAVHAPPPHESLRYTMCGTPEYLSPEMLLGSGHDSTLDMWSLGILTYEILYGRTPFVVNSSELELNLTPDEIQSRSRQKMYEKIISYKDNLSFERKVSRSSFDNGLELDLVEPSVLAKEILSCLIKANKAERLTAKEFLRSNWLNESS